MKIRIKLADIKRAGYPLKHFVWRAFVQKGADKLPEEVVVEATYEALPERLVEAARTNGQPVKGVYKLATGGCILDTQAEPWDN